MLSPALQNEDASSPITGIILLIGIAIIAAMLLLLLCLGFQMPHGEAQVPAVFKITNVVHTNQYGKMIRESYLVLTNKGRQSYRNRYLYVKLFVNGIQVDLDLPTLNGDASCHLHHHGFKNIGGQGSDGGMDKSNAQWYPDQMIWIDFNDGTFGPGDTIRIEVYDDITGQILSRDTYPESKKYDTQWFYNYFLNPQAA
jgi:hypothetical protein